MVSLLPVLHQECARFQARFGVQPLGVVEIGSFARGEAVPYSDHDLRLIIYCADPMLVLDEHSWTDGAPDATTAIDWRDLNHRQDLSFGLTNLAWVEHMLLASRYPLVDHTCLYQGRILLDDSAEIATFRARYHGVRFANIVPDYLRQVDWRVTSELPGELAALQERLDHHKHAVPAVHTCYRIVRDLANIAGYQASGVYAGDPDAIAHYTREHWLWFEPTFDTLRAYKTDERLRRMVFDDIAQGQPERIRSVQLCAQATTNLWKQCQAQYR